MMKSFSLAGILIIDLKLDKQICLTITGDDYSTDTQTSVPSIIKEIRPIAASVQLVQILPSKLFSISIS